MSYAALTASENFRDFVRRQLDTVDREDDFVTLDDYIMAWLEKGIGVEETGGDEFTYLQALVFIVADWGNDPDNFLTFDNGERRHERQIRQAFQHDIFGGNVICIQPGVYRRAVFKYRRTYPQGRSAQVTN